MEDIQAIAYKSHEIWRKFYNWLTKTYGADLHGGWQYMKISGHKKVKYRNFNEAELSRRLVGYDVICRVEKYVKRYCPDIEVVNCDDSLYSGSVILLIPHPSHGITVIFIPQCTEIQNQFFLYQSHFTNLIKALKRVGDNVYKENNFQ